MRHCPVHGNDAPQVTHVDKDEVIASLHEQLKVADRLAEAAKAIAADTAMFEGRCDLCGAFVVYRHEGGLVCENEGCSGVALRSVLTAYNAARAGK